MTQLLKDLLADPFNTYCVDCTKNISSHANISHGTFICLDCANVHRIELGMDKTYIKPIFEDLWDTYQLQVITFTGGNKQFWDFMKDYKTEQKPISIKYNTSEALYYKRRLAALVQDKSFEEKAPARNIDELMDKGLETGKKAVQKGEVLINQMGKAIDTKLQQWFK
ncbi:hypothetical protein FGO68_gene6916 [Halteria grandinella]|uniref:Arf-GAP domain-containing protein n=1 Tax=Halteria grandinella TaxID=5974 RepID=A0A8J8NGE6_HALGN|nr:hypothetical protein FGO68_gene4206 [Halteria grandinella]TNV85715.1 hypothetical protein FGO68_gene6916 [Halteria grandinella]